MITYKRDHTLLYIHKSDCSRNCLQLYLQSRTVRVDYERATPSFTTEDITDMRDLSPPHTYRVQKGGNSGGRG